MRRLPLLLLALVFLVPQSVTARRHEFDRGMPSISYLVQDDLIGCTVWSINQKQGLWVTASHCVSNWGEVGEEGEPLPMVIGSGYTIKQHPAEVVMVNGDADLALLKSEAHEPGLKLGKYPHVGDEAVVYGYPAGRPDPVVLFLRVASVFYQYEQWPWTMLFSGHGWPGHSGSPILDTDGRVISVCQGSVVLGGRGDVGGMTGASWSSLQGFGAGLWEN